MKSRGDTSPAVFHGGNIFAMARKSGCHVNELIDMSSNLTPLGMAPGLKDVLMEHLDEAQYLPETGSESLREVFAGKYNLDKEEILAGNGTTEFIYGIPEALQLKRAVIVNPTYGDYEPACEWSGIAIHNFTLKYQDRFVVDLAELSQTLKGEEIVFLCNPNNPTGVLTSSKAIYDFVKSHPDTFFLVDESYLPFLKEPSLVEFPLLSNLFVLSSFSKIYGIPGLRLGFLIATAGNIAKIARYRKPWGVNRMAQVAGEYLLAYGDDYVADVVQYVAEQRPAFIAALVGIPGVEVIAGSANFILCFLPGNMRADVLVEKMFAKRIMIRNCETFTTLDNRYFRLSLKREQDNAYCLTCLREILAG